MDRLLHRFPADRRRVFDGAAAREAAAAFGAARMSGRPLSVIDAQIIGLALSARSAVATRDSDFEDRGVALVNPWAEA